ncbi:MAG TPA: nucleoside deaminase [Candidatus Brocadiia bacterium]|nr:nucleoside deaminase [Candidatus Brocadiia bacterium]
MSWPDICLKLPEWLRKTAGDEPLFLKSDEGKMRMAVELGRLNMRNRTGGPFGACVFEMETGRLISPGVNLVISSNHSIAHAEVVALAVAQQIFKSYDLSARGTGNYELVTSTEPCMMCMGTALWSGVRRIVCGAGDADAREIGFDEGVKPDNWIAEFEKRGIAVSCGVLRAEAVQVLREYADGDGVVYNARKGMNY